MIKELQKWNMPKEAGGFTLIGESVAAVNTGFYIPELKTVTRVNIKEDLKDYSLHKFKLYLFEDGETLKQKIRAEML